MFLADMQYIKDENMLLYFITRENIVAKHYHDIHYRCPFMQIG